MIMIVMILIRLIVMSYDDYGLNHHREGMPCNDQAPGKEGFLEVAGHKSAPFCQHLICKLW